MSQDGISTILLRYQEDIQSLRQASLGLSRLRGDMQFTAQMAKQVDLASVKAGDSIRDAFGSKTSASIKSLIGPTEDANKQMIRLKESVTGVQQEIKSLSSLKAADIVDPELGDVLGGSGKRNISQTLKFIGREGRALPSQQIPGLGVGTDAISKIIGLMGSLSPVALTTGLAIGGLAIAIKLLQDNATKAKEAALSDLDARQRALELLSAGNKIEVQERIKELQSQRDRNQKAANDAASIQHQLQQGIFETYGIVGFGITQINAALGTGAGELSATAADLEAANKKLGETNTELVILEQGVDALGDAAEKSALALARVNNAIAQDTARINAQIEAANLSASATEQQVQDRLDSLAREKEVLQANLPIMQARADAAEKDSEAQKAAQAQVDNTRQRLGDLDTTLLTLAGDTLQAAKANDIAAESERQRADMIKAVAKFEEERAKISEQRAQKEVDLATKLADKQVEIAAKAVEEAAKLLDNLNQELNSLSTDLGRDLAKDDRKAAFDAAQERQQFQQEEVNETERHFEDIARIRRAALANEFELGLDRDFAGLARSRRATAEQITESNIQFNEDRKARLASFAIKQQDDQAEFAFERNERLIKFDQDVQDARAQYIRERLQLADAKNKQLAAANAAYQKDLALLNSKYRAELSARDQAIRAELQQIQGGNAARLQLDAQYYQQAINILKSAVNSIGGSVSGGASSGSALSSGTGGVSTSGNASTGNLGGIFGAAASRTSTPTRGGLNFGGLAISITTGASPQQVAAIVPAIRKEVDNAITTYHRQIYGR